MAPDPSAPPPSGRQISIAAGDHAATVVEVGGGLRAYTVAGRPILAGYEVHEMCGGGRGQCLMPWPNRIRDGRYSFGGRDLQLPLSQPDEHNAIHGLVRWAAWTVVEERPDAAVLEHLLHPQPGYPFTLEVRVEYHLTTAGLAVSTTATNRGGEPCPFGAGFHPYLTLGTQVVDPLLLTIPAGTRLVADERGIPTGSEPVTGTPYDFRAPRPIGAAKLDTGFGDLEADDDGTVRVRLANSDGDHLELWTDAAYPWVMVFTGDTLDAAGQRRGLAVEPMTCPPDAFNSGRDVLVLEPGETFTGRWGITPALREQGAASGAR